MCGGGGKNNRDGVEMIRNDSAESNSDGTTGVQNAGRNGSRKPTVVPKTFPAKTDRITGKTYLKRRNVYRHRPVDTYRRRLDDYPFPHITHYRRTMRYYLCSTS